MLNPRRSDHPFRFERSIERCDSGPRGNALTNEQRESIVAFETALYTAQIRDSLAGWLTVKGALGGPQNFAEQEFYVGINDLFGDSQTAAPFDPVVFTIAFLRTL